MTSSQESIITKLMHNPKLRFNKLWNQEGPSNTFAYNLKTLEEKGLVKKEDEYYMLTQLGKQESTYIEGITGKKTKMPLIAVSIVIKDENKYLIQQRTKEPFFGYWGFPSGKLDFKYSPTEAAEKELLQETGLKNIKLEFKGIESLKTFNNKKIAYNHQIFIFTGKYNGEEVFKKTREGVLKWYTKKEILALRIFPSIPSIMDFSNKTKLSWIEAERYQIDGKFTGTKTTNEK